MKVQRVDGQTIDQTHERVGDDSLALLYMVPGAIVYIGRLNCCYAHLVCCLAIHKVRYVQLPQAVMPLNALIAMCVRHGMRRIQKEYLGSCNVGTTIEGSRRRLEGLSGS